MVLAISALADIERAGIFRLVEKSESWYKARGFQEIPFGEVGLCRDELRPTLPVEGWKARGTVGD